MVYCNSENECFIHETNSEKDSFVIYKCTDTNSGELLYIGSTKRFDARKREHLQAIKSQKYTNNLFHNHVKQNKIDIEFEIVKQFPPWVLQGSVFVEEYQMIEAQRPRCNYKRMAVIPCSGCQIPIERNPKNMCKVCLVITEQVKRGKMLISPLSHDGSGNKCESCLSVHMKRMDSGGCWKHDDLADHEMVYFDPATWICHENCPLTIVTQIRPSQTFTTTILGETLEIKTQPLYPTVYGTLPHVIDHDCNNKCEQISEIFREPYSFCDLVNDRPDLFENVSMSELLN